MSVKLSVRVDNPFLRQFLTVCAYVSTGFIPFLFYRIFESRLDDTGELSQRAGAAFIAFLCVFASPVLFLIIFVISSLVKHPLPRAVALLINLSVFTVIGILNVL